MAVWGFQLDDWVNLNVGRAGVGEESKQVGQAKGVRGQQAQARVGLREEQQRALARAQTVRPCHFHVLAQVHHVLRAEPSAAVAQASLVRQVQVGEGREQPLHFGVYAQDAPPVGRLPARHEADEEAVGERGAHGGVQRGVEEALGPVGGGARARVDGEQRAEGAEARQPQVVVHLGRGGEDWGEKADVRED